MTLPTQLLKSLSLTAVNTATPRSIRLISSTSLDPSSSSSAFAPKWTPTTQRTGVLARKHGMTCLWDADGIRVPVTVLHLDDVQIITSNAYPSTSTVPAHYSITVGCSPRKVKTTSSSMLGEFTKAGTEPKMRIAEFQITEDAMYTPGTSISAAHFVPGQHVDVQAPSIGKGFQGVMKRWNFRGLRASHGVSISHRAAGSTGQHQDPGRVFRGKKMAGRKSNKNVTTQNLLVHRIDTLHNVIYVRGAVPGPPGGFVRVTDAIKKVGWKAGERARKGLNKDGEVLEGITGFPMVGTTELAKTLPREIEAARRRVVVPSK